jgi:hypothetical protein
MFRLASEKVMGEGKKTVITSIWDIQIALPLVNALATSILAARLVVALHINECITISIFP